MYSITILFPHQLYEQHPAASKSRKIIMVEDWLFFRQYSFHKLKLILHHASMKFYQQWLVQQGYDVEYIVSASKLSDTQELIGSLTVKNVKQNHYADTVENWLEKRNKKRQKKMASR